MNNIRKNISIILLVITAIVVIFVGIEYLFKLKPIIPQFITLLVSITIIPSILLKLIFDYVIKEEPLKYSFLFEDNSINLVDRYGKFWEKVDEIFYSSSAWVGFCERIIIYIAIANTTSASEGGKLIAIVVTIKGFIRYPAIKVSEGEGTKINAEKFLIGTMFSIIFTIFVYSLLN